MSKIKRNDPCTCGSGKKYKKCCGSSNIQQVNHTIINNELDQFHQDLISFVMNTFGNKINELTKVYEKPSLHNNQETADVYNAGLTTWIIFNLAILKNNQTIFDLFYKQTTLDKPVTRELLNKWSHTLPSVYQVVSVNSDRKDFVKLKEIHTEQTYYIRFNQGDDYLEGSLIIGALVPYVDYHTFVYTMLKLYRHDLEQVKDLMKDYKQKDGGLTKHFPDFLAETLLLGSVENEWDNPAHEDVAQLFAKHMVDKDVDDEVIIKGIELWKEYCQKETPTIKKSETYAAALEYMVQKNILNDTTVTQGQLAKEYGTTSATVSTNFRKLNNILS